MNIMGVLARDDREFTLIYSSNTRVGKHTLSYIQGIRDKVNAIDIAQTKVPDTVWAELAETMGVSVGDLVDKRVVKADDTSEFDTNDWLKILQNNNEVLTQELQLKLKVTHFFCLPVEKLRRFNFIYFDRNLSGNLCMEVYINFVATNFI